MRSRRLRLIWSSVAVTTAIVALAATPAGASAALSDMPAGGPPTTLGCQSGGGPLAGTVEYARCQTFAVMDGTKAMACEVAGVCV